MPYVAGIFVLDSAFVSKYLTWIRLKELVNSLMKKIVVLTDGQLKTVVSQAIKFHNMN